MRDHEAVRRLFAEQDDLATRSQLLACGGTDEWIEAQLAARRWRRVARKVYCATTGTPTDRQRDRAALLAAGPVAALSHDSAARRWGLARPDGPRHVVVPYGRSADRRRGVTVHRSRAFDHIVIDDRDLPTVAPADTCVDLAVAEPDARAAMRTVLHAALGLRVAGDAILAVLERRPPPRYRHPLRDAIAQLDEPLASTLEAVYAVDVEDAHGLPRARRQVPVTVNGRERYEDCTYDLPGGTLTVRLDGWRYHSDRHAALVDRARDNAAELDGRARLTFGWEETTRSPCDVAAAVGRVMRRLGWSGPSGAVSCACVPVRQHGNARTRRQSKCSSESRVRLSS